MKTSRLAFPGRFLALSLLLSAGCSREKEATGAAETPKPTTTPAGTPRASLAPATQTPTNADPFADMSAALERATLEQHDGLADIQQRMSQDIDAQVKAKKAGADVSVTTGEKLDTASTDFAEKLRMLSVARPETWNTAKHDATQALQNVRAAYAEVMTSPARR